jgi:hypothetical protein
VGTLRDLFSGVQRVCGDFDLDRIGFNAIDGGGRFDERGLETKRMVGYSDTGNRKGRTQLWPAFMPPRHSSTPQTPQALAKRANISRIIATQMMTSPVRAWRS